MQRKSCEYLCGMQTTSEKSLQLGPALKIGVLGGGQLGRMMIQSAIDLDVRVEVMDPAADAPCRPPSFQILVRKLLIMLFTAAQVLLSLGSKT